jgi:hypothetical protein
LLEVTLSQTVLQAEAISEGGRKSPSAGALACVSHISEGARMSAGAPNMSRLGRSSLRRTGAVALYMSSSYSDISAPPVELYCGSGGVVASWRLSRECDLSGLLTLTQRAVLNAGCCLESNGGCGRVSLESLLTRVAPRVKTPRRSRHVLISKRP